METEAATPCRPSRDPRVSPAGVTVETRARALLRNTLPKPGSGRKPVVRDQLAVEEVLAGNPGKPYPASGQSFLTDVVATGAHLRTAVQILRANLVKRPLLHPLQHGPEVVAPVGARYPVDVHAHSNSSTTTTGKNKSYDRGRAQQFR